jgi:hypothetical protein
VPLLDLGVYAGGNAHHQSKCKSATAAAAAAGGDISTSSSRTELEAGAAPSSSRDSSSSSSSSSRDGTSSESDEESDVESDAAGGTGSAKQRGEVLQDGTMVGTCLWAVQLQLQHPDSGAVLDICMDTSVAQLHERICALDDPSEH